MLMKDGLDLRAAKRIANAMAAVYLKFNSAEFIQQIEQKYQPLELKERVELFIESLSQSLPEDFTKCYDIFMQLKPHWDHGDPNDATRSFAAWPVIDFVAAYGLEHPEQSYPMMKSLTELFSAEFAIRHFIVSDTQTALKYLNQWVDDENHHVRRLVSEGTRPRLPWGIRLKQFCLDPSPCLPLLEKLKDDPSEYVRRSVANHLNDIAKDNPQIVIDLCKTWHKNASKNTQWVIKHACRSLIKSGHNEVFSLLGFTENPKINVEELRLSTEVVNLGEVLEFTFLVTSLANINQHLAIDFVVHHVKANGKLAPKVFKLKELTLAAGQSIELNKKHPIKAITTRKYYAGEHQLDIQINGQVITSTKFVLNV